MIAPAPGTTPQDASNRHQGACIPCVRLFADDVLVTSLDGLSCVVSEVRVPLLTLGFDYGGTVVGARDEATGVFRALGADLVATRRDALAESAARRVLERLGAVELACLDSVALLNDPDADYVVRPDGDAHTFCSFTARALAQFRTLGWRFDVDPAYPFRVVEREPDWFATVEPCDDRPDWFALQLGVDLDGHRVDLLPMLLELLDGADREGGLDTLAAGRSMWALPVSETHRITVPIERIRTLLRVVTQLYQGDVRRGRAFPEIRAGALEGLDGAFRGPGARLVWNGGRSTSSGPSRGTPRGERTLPDRPAPKAPPEGLQATLRPYQVEGHAFLQRLRHEGSGAVLADEMGLGKTLQSIAHLCTERDEGRLEKPALVVAPTTLVGNWVRELTRFAPGLKVVVLHGPARHARWNEARAAQVVVTTYPVLVRDEERFADVAFSVVLLDEAQTIKNARSQARRALERIDCDSRVCLTGTPVENHLGELWSLFDWLTPGLLGEELAFRRFWRQPIEVRRDPDRLQALRAMVAPYVLRRLKSDVAADLPPKTELFVPVELGAKQRELYEAIRVAGHADVRRAIRVKGLAASSVTILDALTKLRQVCCDPRLVAIDAARCVPDSAKLEAFVALLSQELTARHRLLVFSQFTSMLALIGDALRTRGVQPLVLTGQTRERQRVVDAFERGESDVFLISLKAGGTGLNLTSADTVVHYDPWWNPAAQAQATGRAHRIGQTKPVFVHSLYVAGSVEERVLALQRKKRWLSSAVLGDDTPEGAPLQEEDIERLFAPLDDPRQA